MQLKGILFQSWTKPISCQLPFLLMVCIIIFGDSEMEAVSGEWPGDLA
jgi:hypothetical protein